MSETPPLSMYELRPRQRVRNLTTNEEGTVCPQQPYFPEDGPVTVAYDGLDPHYVKEGTMFVIIGQETPTADLVRCGRGENACIFATVGGDGLRCERYTNFHWSLYYKQREMRSKRVPTLPWPKCWVEETKANG